MYMFVVKDVQIKNNENIKSITNVQFLCREVNNEEKKLINEISEHPKNNTTVDTKINESNGSIDTSKILFGGRYIHRRAEMSKGSICPNIYSKRKR